jgi:hypothetical protein
VFADAEFGRVSYTQSEALYARQRGGKVWDLFTEEHFPAEPCDREPEELRALQTSSAKRRWKTLRAPHANINLVCIAIFRLQIAFRG